MKKYLVTGGSGFIGSYLFDALSKKGYKVINFDIKNGDDIRDLNKLLKKSNGCHGIFHLAAIPSVQYSIENPRETFDINLNGTLNILEAARINKIKRVVYSSSSAVYGDQEIMPIKETALCYPQSPYALQKYMGEALCSIYSNLYGIETISLRYFNVYGKGQSSTGAYASVIAKFIDCLNKNIPLTITGNGNQTRDFIHVSDIIQANISAMNAPSTLSGQYFNIGSGKKISVNDIVKILGGKKKYIPARLEPKDSLSDIRKAKKLLKWSPKVDFKKGLLKTIKSL